ncbi:ester cyclase [Pseudomonas protegens]|uniref:Nuclear transport factor 2 family protein n=1 Tax=Pseudomonas sp. W17 TaxID=3144407 RepID=A0AAU7WXA0_9PSED|nr:nuclear transport factor 2 family protein [Pseudomonas protegens]WRV92437.1 nuclear transport factor 2 family protein [Pseudomonas protegens]BAO60182.1 snoaL-like polyketide cyclase [Pseudomonas protegens Cab57]
MTTGPHDYAERAARAFNHRDLESLLALVCEDFIYLDGMGMQSGRESMRKRETALFEAFPDAHMAFTPFIVADDRLALTALLTGTFTAPLVLPGKVIPAHGRPIAVHYSAHFTFRNGLACREEVFFDSSALMLPVEQQKG